VVTRYVCHLLVLWAIARRIDASLQVVPSCTSCYRSPVPRQTLLHTSYATCKGLLTIDSVPICHELRGIGTHHQSGNLNHKARCGGRHDIIGLGWIWLEYKDGYRFEYKDGYGTVHGLCYKVGLKYQYI